MASSGETAAFHASGQDDTTKVDRILNDFLDDELFDFSARLGELQVRIAEELQNRGIG